MYNFPFTGDGLIEPGAFQSLRFCCLRLPTTVRLAVVILCLPLFCLGATDAKAKKSNSHTAASHSTKHSKTPFVSKSHARGQASPSSDRTREIQMALIREHYMSGEPNGSWDNGTREALTRFQADHGWQTKLVPDSRALIKLGLGPSREGLLNPDTAAISPHELGAEHPQPGGSASN
jgi:hypothetical protein